jgi:hypothetical protein
MAIQKSYTLNVCDKEVIFENAYCKVNKQEGTKNIVYFDVTFLTQKDGQKIGSEIYQFTPDLSGANFIAQAYEHLKTLPEFAGAEDC